LYNASQEGLYGPVKHDRSAFDLFALCLGTKNGFVKFCKAHEQRIRINLHDFRVIRADVEEGDTYISVGGFLTEWTKSKKSFRPMKIDMQFLDHHRKQYLNLHAEWIRFDYSPQSEAASTNFKALLLLEISLLHGCDYDWSTPVAASVSEGEVLCAGAAADADNSGEEQGVPAAVPAAVPASAAAPPAAPARAQSPAGIVDVNDFITWTPETWALLDWDTITFPTDPAIKIRSVRYYLAVAMIMWYQADLRDKHKRVWDELNYAWLATFSCVLNAVALEKWPETGPFAFDKVQSKWLTDTLHFLKQSTARPRRQIPPPRAPADVPPASLMRKRNSDPVQQIPKKYIIVIIVIITII
jgi:hypothetical protein